MASGPDAKDAYLFARHEGRQPGAPSWFSAALDLAPERGHFLSSGSRIELLTWGKVGRPGLLFIHGNRAHADWWSFIAPFFADDWRCAAISLSGMGGSQSRAEQSTIPDFVGEAHDAIEAAGLTAGGHLPILVGHSLGGSVGVNAVAGNDRFRGLVLVDTPINHDPERARAAAAAAPKPRASHRPFGSLAEGLGRFRLSPAQPYTNDFILDFIARKALVEQNSQWFWRFDPRGVVIGNITDEAPLARIGCPIAMIYGDRSPYMRAFKCEAARALLRAGSPFVAIPDAGHHVLIDQPLALVSALRTLLACWPGGPAELS
jgi:pimeloyl-ACP methyl ester carboxylesterase